MRANYWNEENGEKSHYESFTHVGACRETG